MEENKIEREMNKENFYSSEVTDIIGKLPSWTVRWGITVVAVILIGILIGCWMIKYPQTIDSNITITTINPPIDLKTRMAGNIHKLFVADNGYIKSGQPVALIHSTTNYTDIEEVYDSLKKMTSSNYLVMANGKWMNNNYQLGEIQQVYENFRLICSEVSQYVKANNIEKKKNILSAQVEKNKRYLNQLSSQSKLVKEDIKHDYQNESREKSLFDRGLISKHEYEEAVRARLKAEQGKVGGEANLTSAELSVMQKQQQIVELDMQYSDDMNGYYRQITQYRQHLLTAIEQWRYSYVIVSPIDGRVSFLKYWSENQHVSNGETLVSIIPLESSKIIGRMYVSTANFGKVKVGKSVIVKLNGYPYMEFGSLVGKITNISSVPDENNNYITEVDFPNGLKTTYNKPIRMIQRMDGQGQIVVKDMRLIERFIQPIRELFNRSY